MDQIRPRHATWLVPIIAATIGLVLAGCVIAQVSWINGSWYWFWAFRSRASLPALRWYGPMLLAATPIIAAWFIVPRSRARAAIAVTLLMIGVLALKLVSVAVVTKPASFTFLAEIVRSPVAISYYVNAAALQHVDGPLAVYPEFISHPAAHLHTRSKPPGPVMYYLAFIRLFGFGDRSAILAGIVLGALATLSIPATYLLIHLFTSDRSAALVAATMLSLCPGFLYHFPTFDPIYPVFACALIAFWHVALARNDRRFAGAFGVTLAATTFATYNVLVLGALLAAMSVRRNIRHTITLALVAMSALIGSYVILWIFTSFDPFATFQAALTNQRDLLARHAHLRPYPATIWFDLVDFALGFGWIALIPIVLGFARLWNRRDPLRCLATFALGLPLLVAVLGVLQSETSRVWIFMLPIFFLPAAIELQRRWSPAQRTMLFATMLLIALVIGHNMVFLIP